jgi:hypothetical protein
LLAAVAWGGWQQRGPRSLIGAAAGGDALQASLRARLTLSAQATDGGVEIAVADTGPAFV